MKNSLKKTLSELSMPAKILAGVAVVVALVAVWARTYHLAFPEGQVFDEVYFPVFAKQYLDGKNVFDVHPPLGKFIIAVAIALFGDHPFSWRLMPSLFGLAIPFVGAWGWWHFRKDRVGAVIIGILLALEPILITYSRTGLLDGLQLFFILMSFALAARLTKRRHLIWLAVFIGFSVSIKWVALAIVVPVVYMMWRKGKLLDFIPSLSISLIIYLAIVAYGQFLNGEANPWAGLVEWHHQAYYYHLNLNATHPWSSLWWGWPLMLRPVLFYYETDPFGNVQVISSIGNPILWWASSIAAIASLSEVVYTALLEKKKVLDHPLVPLLLGYLAFFLPWAAVHRIVFLYHYIPAYAFALLMLTYWLRAAWNKSPWLVLGFLLIVIAVGVFYLPMVMALPMSPQMLQNHLWLKSWL